MKPLIERLLTPRKEPAPYPDGWYEVVDPDKREAAKVIQQQRDLLEECERALGGLLGECDNHLTNKESWDKARTTLAKLRAEPPAQEKRARSAMCDAVLSDLSRQREELENQLRSLTAADAQ